MAKIVFSLEELLSILVANEVLPDQIQKAQAKGDTVEFVVKTGVIILPMVPVSLKYVGYEGEEIEFELSVAGGRFGDMIAGFAKQFESKMPEGVRLEFPKVYVDVGKMLEVKNVRGLKVSEISVNEGEFTVVASSS